MSERGRSAARTATLVCAVSAACGSSPNGPAPIDLPAQPLLLSPADGAQLTTDTPTFVVQNAQAYDQGQADYSFRVLIANGNRQIAALTVPAGLTMTSMTFASPLLRGTTLRWDVTAKNAGGQVASGSASFRLPAVDCVRGRDPYAKSVVEWSVPACSLAQNHYSDPLQVLGPPDAGGHGPDSFFGFISLGEGGHVTVDMETCAADGPGPDVRVYQSVSSEPVTLYASGLPGGPWVQIAHRVACGERSPGLFSNHCDFDLAGAGIEEARYFKIEDGELYPCPGDTVTEGADIDAIQILSVKP